MKYKIVFDTYICDSEISQFMKCADLGIDAIGKKAILSVVTTSKPTKTYIAKMIIAIDKMKDAKRFCTGTALNRIEKVEDN
jgi:hypothetical protein